MVADSDEPSFDPEGGVFELFARAEETLASDSTLASASFIVEAANGGDVLTADAFREWSRASIRIRSDGAHVKHLVTRFDAELGSDIPGVLSIVDVVNEAIPGGLDTATDADVKTALADVLGATK